MHRGVLAALGLCLAFSVQAEGLLSKKDISEIVANMAQAYKADKKNGMREVESECWKAVSSPADKDGAHGGLAYCGMVGMTGQLIASSEAEKYGKSVQPYWTEDAVVARMVKYAQKMKIKTHLVEEVMDDDIEANAEILAKALMKKGFLLD